LADKGYKTSFQMLVTGNALVTPATMHDSHQFSAADALRSMAIARRRVLIEQVMQAIRSFTFFNSTPKKELRDIVAAAF